MNMGDKYKLRLGDLVDVQSWSATLVQLFGMDTCDEVVGWIFKGRK